MDFTLLVKKSTDETCAEWADKLDKLLFRGKKQFLKKCPVYNIEPRRFDEYGGPMRTFRRIINYGVRLKEMKSLLLLRM